MKDRNALNPMNAIPPRTTTRLHSPVPSRIMLTKRTSELAAFSSWCFRAMVFHPLGSSRLLDLSRHRVMLVLFMLILRLLFSGSTILILVEMITFNGPSRPLQRLGRGTVLRDFIKPYVKIADEPRHR